MINFVSKKEPVTNCDRLNVTPMQTYISILRGINVSGQKMIKMKELKALYEGLGFENVRTYIQSGNVIFEHKDKQHKALPKLIGEGISKNYGFEVPIVIRTVEEIEAVLYANPFLKKEDVLMDRLYVTFLADEPQKEHLEKVKVYDYPPEEFIILNKEVYLHCPTGYGEAKLNNNFFENKLKVTATTRNWRTVNELYKMAKG